MKNDVVFQFFQQKQKMALFPANAAIVTTLSNYNSSKLNSTPPAPEFWGGSHAMYHWIPHCIPPRKPEVKLFFW